MSKVKITADAVLAIIQGIFRDEDINITVTDPDAPPSWAGKTVEEILNVEYYTFKHRPISTQTVISKMLEENGGADKLAALNRSLCLCSLGEVERLFSKDADMAAVTANLEYYIQTSKIKLLEYLVECCNVATSGLRIPVTFGEGEGGQTRRAVVVFGPPSVGDIQTAGPFGETAIVDIGVDIVLYPDVVSYSEYEVSFDFTDRAGVLITGCRVPLASFSFAAAMSPKSIPLAERPEGVGTLNLSCAKSCVLVFEGYNNPFINHVAAKSLANPRGGDTGGNNEAFMMTVTRGGENFTHEMSVTEHQIVTNADTGNETHTLKLSAKGI